MGTRQDADLDRPIAAHLTLLGKPVGTCGHDQAAQGGQAGQAGNDRGPKAAGRLKPASSLAWLASPYSNDGSFQTARMIPASEAGPTSAQTHHGHRLPCMACLPARCATPPWVYNGVQDKGPGPAALAVLCRWSRRRPRGALG